MRGLVDLLRKHNDITSEQIAKWIGQFDADHYRGIACAKATDTQKRLDRKHYREAFESSFPARVLKVAA